METNTYSIITNRLVTDGEVILLAIGWTAIFFMLLLVFFTYLIAWNTSQPRSRALGALALFFGAVEIQIAYNAIITWTFLAHHQLSLSKWTNIRVFILFLATIGVFYTAWHRKRNIKIVEVKKDETPHRRIDDPV